MKQSNISWTDFSGGIWNIVTGCTPADRSCANCYAKAIYRRFGRVFDTVQIHPDKLARWSTAKLPTYSPKRGAPHRPMVFVVDMGDLFHEQVPNKFIWDALDIMERRSDVVWQLLTKRAFRMAYMIDGWCWHGHRASVPDHIWLGVSICDQETANKRIPILLDTLAAVHFTSVEPLLGPVDLEQSMARVYTGGGVRTIMAGMTRLPRIDWVICGGESGPKRRPFDVRGAVDLYEQCRTAGVAFYGKQASGLRPGEPLHLPGYGLVHEWPNEGGR